MAAQKKFIKEKLFKDKKVEDVFEDLYEDFLASKNEISELVSYFFETHKLEKAEMLQAMDTIVKLESVKDKKVDNMIKITSVLQKAVASENKPSGTLDDSLPADTLDSLIAEIDGNSN